jgi:prepilin-type N-terminal cleavage/methylation domain-containing protein
MKRMKNNKGISLIEILVALVILALLMTAVISLMMNNNIIFRKTKNDLDVQNSADETFSMINDILMSSKYVYVDGYTCSGDQEFSKTESGASSSLTFTGIQARSKVTGMVSSTYTFDKDEVNLKDIYVKKLVIVSSVPLDSNVMNYSGTTDITLASGGTVQYHTIPSGKQGPDKYYMIGTVKVDDQDKALLLKPDIPSMTTDTTNHNVVVGDSDRCIYTLYFSGSDIYMTKEYMYQTDLNTITAPNDDPTTWDKEVQNSLRITDSLNYVDSSGTEISGAVFRFDRERNGVGVKLYFNQENMTYTVENMVRIHNSGVVGGEIVVE